MLEDKLSETQDSQKRITEKTGDVGLAMLENKSSGTEHFQKIMEKLYELECLCSPFKEKIM